MRRILSHLRWWFAHLLDSKHIISENAPAHLEHYWTDELDPVDPRDTYQEGD